MVLEGKVVGVGDLTTIFKWDGRLVMAGIFSHLDLLLNREAKRHSYFAS